MCKTVMEQLSMETVVDSKSLQVEAKGKNVNYFRHENFPWCLSDPLNLVQKEKSNIMDENT